MKTIVGYTLISQFPNSQVTDSVTIMEITPEYALDYQQYSEYTLGLPTHMRKFTIIEKLPEESYEQ